MSASRFDHRQPSQKLMQITAARTSGNHVAHFGFFRGKVPGERCREIDCLLIGSFRDEPGLGIIESDAEFAFIFAGKLTHLQRTRFRGRLPVDMARRIVGQVFANAVQIGAAAAHKTLPLAAHQRKNFEDLVGRLNARINQNLARQ